MSAAGLARRGAARRGPRARLAAAAAGGALALAAACGAGTDQRPDIRLKSDNFAFEISVDSGPPRARERTLWKIVVRDAKSRQFVEGGEGRLFAESLDHKTVWNGLLAGDELGTYYATLNFVTSGDWAIGLQFRRDSLAPLERVDWMQTVRAAR